MAASADIKFKESLLTALRCLNLGTLTLRKEQENAVKNVVVRKKDVLVVLPTGFGKSLIFQMLPFVFDSWLYTNGSFILVVSPLNALMRDQIIKLDNLNVKTLIIRCGDSVSKLANQILCPQSPSALVLSLRRLRGPSGSGDENGFALFGFRSISRAAKPKIPFIDLSSLRNQTETLATHATKIYVSHTLIGCIRKRSYTEFGMPMFQKETTGSVNVC